MTTNRRSRKGVQHNVIPDEQRDPSYWDVPTGKPRHTLRLQITKLTPDELAFVDSLIDRHDPERASRADVGRMLLRRAIEGARVDVATDAPTSGAAKPDDWAPVGSWDPADVNELLESDPGYEGYGFCDLPSDH